MTATVEIAESKSWEFKVERRQENITATTRVSTLHLEPLEASEAPVSSMKVNLTDDPDWARGLTPERMATIVVTFGPQRKTSTLEEHDDEKEGEE